MFIKSFRTKSNVQLKSSDRKKLQTKVAEKFPTITPDELNGLFSSKANVSLVKIITHSEQIITVYAIDKRPLFFETPEHNFLPTVYALWLLPNMVEMFTTHPAVLPRLANGADLMLPGIIKKGQGLHSYGFCSKDEIVGVNLTSNKAAVGIGMLCKSSHDLYMSGGVGVGVKMLHVFGDKLWAMESSACLQIPFLGVGLDMPDDDDFPQLGEEKSAKIMATPKTAPVKQQQSVQKVVKNIIERVEAFPALGMDPRKKSKTIQKPELPEQPILEQISSLEIAKELSNKNIEEIIEPSNDKADSDENAETAEDTISLETDDVILKNAFFTALKRDGKSLALPLLTSAFYRCNVIPAAERQIDLKKTSYKKLSKFLTDMAANRFIVLKEEQKGVEKIVSVNLTHPELMEFIPKVSATKDEHVEKQNSLFVTEMTELYLVTDETVTFFAHFNVNNGEGVESAQIKKFLKEYVCNNKLQNPLNLKHIRLNPLLAKLCDQPCVENNETLIPFDNLLSIILSKMRHSYEMRSKNELKSSKKPMITMSLATRSGNKKVTLVNNLEAFGIRLAEFEKACKIGVAASTTITKLPYQKGEQLLVQGNQVRFIFKLLTETYKIPAKNIVGMDLAKKEKKPAKK